MKKLEALKARLFEKKAESQSMGTIIGIIIAVVAGLAILAFVVALIKDDGIVGDKVNDAIDGAFDTSNS